ncbi:uncharacterized protein LOC115891364 [Sitophilus oryzae]|uniref:Uncharacterized protein LOC115891364 n=1 Tax=Sitophilus oryzae TaxID=7048 RepID=A0A6J2YWV2_SITOR|nr:uncharacterized protein LOC115891364 [Sitophilus oryzae]
MHTGDRGNRTAEYTKAQDMYGKDRSNLADILLSGKGMYEAPDVPSLEDVEKLYGEVFEDDEPVSIEKRGASTFYPISFAELSGTPAPVRPSEYFSHRGYSEGCGPVGARCGKTCRASSVTAVKGKSVREEKNVNRPGWRAPKRVHSLMVTANEQSKPLIAIFYPKLNEADKAVLRHNFKIFIQEDSPMVRRGAALAFEDFISVVEDEFVRHEFVPMFCDIALDPMEAIKCISIDIAIALAKRLGESPLNESIFKTIEAASGKYLVNI